MLAEATLPFPTRSPRRAPRSVSVGSQERPGTVRIVIMERPARIHQVVGYVRAEKAPNAELQVKGAGREQEYRICRDGCPRGNHCGGNRRGAQHGPVTRDYPQSAGSRASTDRQTRQELESSGLL